MKRITAVILTLILALSVLPAVVAAEAESIAIIGIELTNRKYLAVGAAEAADTAPENGGYAYYENGVLTLNGFVINDTSDEGRTIESAYPLEIALIGENKIESENIAVSVNGSSLTFNGEGSLEITAKNVGILFSPEGINADFTVNSGNISIYTKEGEAISAHAKNTVFTLNGGKLSLESGSYSGLVLYSDTYTELTVNGGELTIIGDEGYGAELTSRGNVKCTVNGGKLMIPQNLSITSVTLADEGLYINGGTLLCKNLWIAADNLHIGDNVTYTVLDDGTKVFTEVSASLGDINADGDIDKYDYILVKRHCFGTRGLAEEEMSRADVNSDGNIDRYDYILIKRHCFKTYVIGE